MSKPNTQSKAQMQPVKPNAKAKQVQPQKAKDAKIFNKNKNNEDALLNYKLALTSPFDSRAVGAQVPDQYAYPTATYHAEGTVTLTSDSNGIASVELFANPFMSLIDMGGGAVSGANCGMYQYSGESANFYAASSQAALENALQGYRVVGCGFEIRNLLAPNNATGRVIAATVPVLGQPPGPNALAGAVLLNSYVSDVVVGIGSQTANTHLPSDILEYPTAQEVTLQDLITQALAINLKPISPQAFFFDSANNGTSKYNSTLSLAGGNTITTSTGVPIANDSLQVSVLGWDALLLRCEGLPVSTANCLEIKYIMHFEGPPVITLTASSGALAPAIKPKAVVAPVRHMQIIEDCLNSPSIRMIAKNVATAGIAYATGGQSALLATMAAKLGLTM